MAVDTATVIQRLTELESARTSASNALEQIDGLRAQLEDSVNVDPLPVSFVGVIKDYRYRSGAVDEMPKHTMRIAVDSTLVLWCSVPSAVFEENIMQTVRMKSMDKLNGKLVLCERRSTYGVTPVRLLDDPFRREDGSYAVDSFGRVLYPGARVYRKARNSQGTVRELVNGNNTADRPIVSVEYDNRDDMLNEYSDQLIRLV